MIETCDMCSACLAWENCMMLQLKYSAGQDNATGRDCMAGDD